MTEPEQWREAMVAILTRASPKGLTPEDFFTRAARLCGESEEAAQAAIELFYRDHPNGTRILPGVKFKSSIRIV